MQELSVTQQQQLKSSNNKIMKKSIYFLLAIFSFSCSSTDGDNAPNLNSAPETPELISPSNNQLCIDNNINFKWNVSNDVEGDDITYLIEISKDNSFYQIAKSGIINQNNKNYELAKGQAYYWRVSAKDTKGNKSAYSTIFNLYTEGEAVINHLPFNASLVSPLKNASVFGTTILLKWQGEDVDNDELTYDLYFGEDDELSLLQSEINLNEFSVNIAANKNYSWRIDTIDSNNAKTAGTTWNFHTD